MPEPGQTARKTLDAGRAALLAKHREGAGGLDTVRAISRLTDEVLGELFAALCADSPESAPLAVAATGGYGRSELSPRSDIDLLALLPTDSRRERAESIAERLHRALWDLGLEVGFAARTIDQCVALAREDHTIRTALLDARFVSGDRELMNGLERAIRTQIEPRNVEDFIGEKVEEVAERRRRYGGSVWLLEPHLKQGTGGLRDLQAGLWIARARHGIAGLREAGDRELLPRRDVETAARARDTLLRLRNELHWLSGRRDDRLTFENQRKAAASLGYKDSKVELAVEKLMRDAYVSLQEIARASDALIDRCAREDAPRAALSRKARRKPVDDSFSLLEGRIVVNDREVFSRRPAEIVRMYLVAEIASAKVSSSARDMAVRELDRLGQDLETDRDAHRELWALLVHDGAQGEALIPLHELGVLAAMFPEMRRLHGRAQHSLYHVYTVDTHTVFALARLMKLRAGGLSETEPELTRIARDLERPLALMLGLLFHDLGKGLGDDHSKRGAQLVREYAARVGLEPEDTEDVAWLVLVHLRMAHLSQRRDLEDVHLIDEFAREVRTVERLEMLYLLTYADMSSVSAENYTTWKAGLLRAMYEKTHAALLSEGLDAPAHAQNVDLRRARLKERLQGLTQADAFVDALPERYLSLHASRHDVAARDLDLWRIARKSGFAGELRSDELTLCAPDRPGLLALFAAALAANGIDILAAEVTSLGHDVALDRFTVREAGGGFPSEHRWQSARADLLRLLAGDEEPARLVAKRLRRASWAAGKAPPVKTKMRVDGGVLEVNTEDRPGLLHAIAEALHGASVSIAVARVATEGNKAVDSFYLEDLAAGRAPGRLQDPERISQVILAVESAIASLAARG